MSAARRVGSFALVSGLAAVVAALGAGLSEAMVEQTGPLRAAAAVGFVSFLAVPLGFLVSALGRVIWRAWRPDEVANHARDPVSGGAPRFAAWAAYLALAAFALAAAVLQGMNRVVVMSTARVVYVLAAPILAVGTAVILTLLSRPVVLGLTRAFTALDRRWAARRGAPLFRPRAVLLAALVLGVVMAALAWFLVVRPEVGHLDLAFVPSVGLWILLLAAVPPAWSWLGQRPRARLAAMVAVLVSTAAAVGAAVWMRYRSQLDMLGIWGESRLAGFIIDTLYDVEGLRSELDLDSFRPPARAGAPHRDIILVTIDTVRADRTPPYGGSAEMPALARMAREGAVFMWSFSPGNVTRRSLPAMLMGLSAPRLRGRVKGWALKLDPRHVLLAERLRAAGYRTAGFFCCTSQFGPEHRLGLIRGIEHQVIEKDGEDLAAQAAAWLRQRHDARDPRPVFLWMHLIEPHGWEKSHPASSEARRRTQRYDLSLTDADRALGILLDEAWRGDGRERRYVVVTSDHGEALGDHGSKNHAETLYNSEIRVPLVVVGPDVPVRRVPRPVGLHDLAPTLLDLAGFVPPGMPEMDGESFAGVARGEAPHGIEYGSAYAAMITDRSVEVSQRALVEGRWKLIQRGGRSELYDLVADPAESKDLSRVEADVLTHLKGRMTQRREIEDVDPF